MNITLLDILEEKVKAQPTRPLLTGKNASYTYAHFYSFVLQIGTKLQANGYQRRDKVALYLDEFDDFFL